MYKFKRFFKGFVLVDLLFLPSGEAPKVEKTVILCFWLNMDYILKSAIRQYEIKKKIGWD